MDLNPTTAVLDGYIMNIVKAAQSLTQNFLK